MSVARQRGRKPTQPRNRTRGSRIPSGSTEGTDTMNITVFRGTHEIGGTLIEVTSGTTRLILDAGLPLVDANRDPFDSFKALRSTCDELIASGTIPPVPGLFTH